MTDIIKRLEAATEGSRELDRLVQANKHNDPARKIGPMKLDIVDMDKCPAYTTSLDAKLPGEDISHVIRFGPGHWTATMWNTEGKLIRGDGKTEALARRIAALRARGVE